MSYGALFYKADLHIHSFGDGTGSYAILNIQQLELPTAPHCHTDPFEVVVCIYGSAIECFYEKQVK